MSRLTELIATAKAKDPQFGVDLQLEFRALSSRLSFGLNFERHRPEAVELPQRAVRKGDKVRILPPRGSLDKGDQRLWQVKKIIKDGATKRAELECLDAPTEQSTAPVPDLIVVAEFRDTIYPGLVSNGKVVRGAGKPWHTVINGENYHVLKALTWTHRGKIDAIYIDPPYNTRDRDWKYNNDYVNSDDLYRHSKWLAMMERRLLVAKELLNPADSLLIVTIDEKEYLRLGLLLEQTFPEAEIQMITSVINPKGTARANEFARIEEYIFFAKLGGAKLTRWNRDMLTERDYSQDEDVRWRGLARTGRKGLRSHNPGSWYPIYVRSDGSGIHSVGETVPIGSPDPTDAPKGTIAIWPPSSAGKQYSWSVVPESLRDLMSRGAVRIGRVDLSRNSVPIYYLSMNQLQRIEDGDIKVVGRAADGTLEIAYAEGSRSTAPRTVWNMTSHDAGSHGTNMIGTLLPGRTFPFPKSLYAVEDALRFFVASKTSAVILDFFAGSGTTAHAVMRLNKQDGGNRQCISVTNNEVAADEQKALREKGLRPGDLEWEKWGICDYITKPRVAAAITGKTPDGHPIDGDYQFGQVVKKERPRRFTHISFVKPAELNTVAKKKQFLGLIDSLPQTLATDSCPFVVSDDEKHTASVLFDPDASDDWLQALDGQEHITEFVIVAPDNRTFKTIKEQVVELLGPVIVTEKETSPMANGFEENAEFFTLTYETPVAVSYQTAFARIAPLLWIRAGSVGRRIDTVPTAGWEVADAYGLLVELDKSGAFLKAARKAKALRIAYVVTDDERRFQALARHLPEGVEPIRLYESYLTNFAFANGD